MAAQAEKPRYRTLRVPDPAYLMLRAKQGVRPGALSRQSRAKVVGQRFLLVNGWPKDASAKAWGVVKIEPGSAFRDGSTAIKELGAKLDELTQREFASESGQVWFHPLAVVEEYKEPVPVARQTPGPRAGRGTVDKQDVDPTLLAGQSTPEPMEKGLFGYPAGKSAMAKLLVGMMPEHNCYVEPFVGSGAVLLAKEPAKTEVINDANAEIAAVWKTLCSMSEADVKRLVAKDWVGRAATYQRLRASSGGDAVNSLYRFLYLSRFSLNQSRGKAFRNDSEGTLATTPVRLAKIAPRLRGVRVHAGDYESVSRKYDSTSTLFFFDPPYRGHDAGVGERAFDEQRFFRFLRSLKGKWIVTYGGRGELPGMLRSAGYPMRQHATHNSFANTRPGAQAARLNNIIAHNYKLSSGVSKSLAPVAPSGDGGRNTEALLLASGAIEREVAKRSDADPGDDLLGQARLVIKELREHVAAAVWSTAYKNRLPDSAFLYVAPGGQKDGEGKTVPRALRYFPVRDDKGKLDIPHLRNAIARIPQSSAPGLTADKMRDLQDRARRLLEEARKKTAVSRVQAGDSVAKEAPPLTDLDEVLGWAADVLKDGVAVEPKCAGPTVVVQRDSDGVVALLLDGAKVEQTEPLSSLSKAAEALDRPALMVGGLVGHDGDARMLVRDVLHWGDTDVTDRPWDERRPFRKRALRGIQGIQGDAFVDAPSRVVYTEQDLRDAIRWAGREPGSLGAVLKSINGTCDGAGHAMDAVEFLATRGVDVVVLDHQIKKDALARVYTCGVGPVDNPDDWQHTTEVRGRHYVTIGKTFASNITAEPGDVLRIEATELLLDTREPRNLTWFAPTVVEKIDSQPMKPADVERLVRPDEIKKHFVIKAKHGEYERYVFGLVLEPNDGGGGNPFAPDLQKDTYSAEEIWTAWWNYAVDSRKQGLLHRTAVDISGMVLLDNYVVPDDMTVNGQHFRKGSWVMGAHVKDDALWKGILDGTYNGWSIQGSAIRELMRRAA